jgi:hypothetical protein
MLQLHCVAGSSVMVLQHMQDSSLLNYLPFAYPSAEVWLEETEYGTDGRADSEVVHS